jgi:hypothetical protein
MKRLLAGAFIGLLGCPLIASCQTAASRAPSPAVLAQSTAQCRTQLNVAVRELRGRAVTLAPDAFTQNDSVVLSTVGQSASGRMAPPTDILRLQLGSQGCQLQLEGRDQVVALPQCTCRAAAAR